MKKSLKLFVIFIAFSVKTCAERIASSKAANGRLLRGAFTPQCEETGEYKNKQCHGSTGYCWCVDTKNGKEIQGTRKNVRTVGADSLQCGKSYFYFSIIFCESIEAPVNTDLHYQFNCLYKA